MTKPEILTVTHGRLRQLISYSQDINPTSSQQLRAVGWKQFRYKWTHTPTGKTG